MTQYNYIVIAAGSAGYMVANYLTEDSETTVLLVNVPIVPLATTGNTNTPTIMIGEKVADSLQASQTRQTLMAKYNVTNPAHLPYLGVGDRDW